MPTIEQNLERSKRMKKLWQNQEYRKMMSEAHKGQIPVNLESNHKKIKGKGNWKWKGDNAGYRALHAWINKWKGKPIKCIHCGKIRTTPKSIHWANIDHKYRRNLNDYISLCASCHKKYDLKNGFIK